MSMCMSRSIFLHPCVIGTVDWKSCVIIVYSSHDQRNYGIVAFALDEDSAMMIIRSLYARLYAGLPMDMACAESMVGNWIGWVAGIHTHQIRYENGAR